MLFRCLDVMNDSPSSPFIHARPGQLMLLARPPGKALDGLGLSETQTSMDGPGLGTFPMEMD